MLFFFSIKKLSHLQSYRFNLPFSQSEGVKFQKVFCLVSPDHRGIAASI